MHCILYEDFLNADEPYNKENPSPKTNKRKEQSILIPISRTLSSRIAKDLVTQHGGLVFDREVAPPTRLPCRHLSSPIPAELADCCQKQKASESPNRTKACPTSNLRR
jgi:hypothetical protein